MHCHVLFYNLVIAIWDLVIALWDLVIAIWDLVISIWDLITAIWDYFRVIYLLHELLGGCSKKTFDIARLAITITSLSHGHYIKCSFL